MIFNYNLLTVAATLTGMVTSVVAIMLLFLQFRKSEYSDKFHRIELDQSRMALERQMERLYGQIYKDADRWNELNHLLIDSVRKTNETGTGLSDPTWGFGGSRFLTSMGIDPSKITPKDKAVFVLTPFNRNHRAEYEKISEVCTSVGLTCSRGDEVKIVGPILPHIVRQIAESALVIANINGRNANVFYELGIAQALGKPVIMISKSYGDLPFDLRQQQIVLYDDLEELNSMLTLALSRSVASFR